MKRVLIIIGILLIPTVPIVLVVTGVIKTNPTTVAPITLSVWGAEDSRQAFDALIADYAVNRPYATITYTKVRSDNYLDTLISAWATGTGPDIFFVPNTWIGQMQQYAVAMPKTVSVPYVQTGTGVFRSGTEVTKPVVAAPTLTSLREQFVDGVTQDVIREDQIWAMALSMDTVVTYYNKELLNNSQIFSPAKTWTELLSQIDSNKLTLTDEQDNIVRSAVALGTSDNIPYATDLLSLLFMQNGVASVVPQTPVKLREAKAQVAFDFFLSFSNPKKISYSWNATQPNAREAFLSGKLAYFFGTHQDRDEIIKSGVSWGVGPMLHLQTDGDQDASGQRRIIDVARYQVGMVAKASEIRGRSVNAWNFLYFLAREQNVKKYLAVTDRLSAIRNILSNQKDNPNLQVYANQLLTARSWYRARSGSAFEDFLNRMIADVNSGKTTAVEALQLADEQLNASL